MNFTTYGSRHRVAPQGDYRIHAALLPNPHGVLTDYNGQDPEVQEWLLKKPGVPQALQQWAWEIEHRGAKNIVIGCIGGRHRSVFVAEWLARHFRAKGQECRILHLELRRHQN